MAQRSRTARIAVACTFAAVLSPRTGGRGLRHGHRAAGDRPRVLQPRQRVPRARQARRGGAGLRVRAASRRVARPRGLQPRRRVRATGSRRGGRGDPRTPRGGRPGQRDVLLASGWALHEAGRDAEALARYDAAAALAPENQDALYNAGLILWAAGRTREAADRFVRLLAIAPGDADALYNLGSLELALDDPAGAAEHLGRYVERKPQDAEGLLLLASAWERQRQFSRALEAYDRIIAADARSASAWFGRARLLLTVVEDPERGLQDLRRALDAGFSDTAAVAALLANETLLVPARSGEGARRPRAAAGISGGARRGALSRPRAQRPSAARIASSVASAVVEESTSRRRPRSR